MARALETERGEHHTMTSLPKTYIVWAILDSQGFLSYSWPHKIAYFLGTGRLLAHLLCGSFPQRQAKKSWGFFFASRRFPSVAEWRLAYNAQPFSHTPKNPEMYLVSLVNTMWEPRPGTSFGGDVYLTGADCSRPWAWTAQHRRFQALPAFPPPSHH